MLTAKKRVGRPPKARAALIAPWHSKAVSDQVQEMLNALELTLVDADVFNTLARWVYRADKYFGGDRGTIIVALRCLAESDANGPKALTEPILRAVHAVCRPEWTCMGLAFVAAFDELDLRVLLRSMRDLRCFKPYELTNYLAIALRRRLEDTFGVRCV